MPRNQKLSGFLRALAHLLEEEAARNVEFAARLDVLLTPVLRSPQSRNSRPDGQPHFAGVPDVLSALVEKGEEEFRFWLRSFDLATLKAIIKSNGFDVARSSRKWTDPDKFINLIVEQASARLRRGSGFLPPPTGTNKENDLAERKNMDITKKVIVHSFEAYDIHFDRYNTSPRKATLEAISRIRTARVIAGTDEEIDASRLDGDEMYRSNISNADVRSLTRRDTHPLPDSHEAIARGCKCTIAKKANGSPILDQNGNQLYVIEKGCPIHG